MQFQVNRTTHIELVEYLPSLFFMYLNQVDEHPNYAYFTGQESPLRNQHREHFYLQPAPLTSDEYNDLNT